VKYIADDVGLVFFPEITLPRRLEHLASLGLSLAAMFLEVGAGVGDLTSFFLDRLQCHRDRAAAAEPDMVHLGIWRVRLMANRAAARPARRRLAPNSAWQQWRCSATVCFTSSTGPRRAARNGSALAIQLRTGPK
jgi:hypothetical protein